jgi:hypothetical protein
MKKIFFYLFIIPIFCKGQSMSDIKSAVSFVYVKDSLGNPVPNGTCFFVGIRSKKDTSQYYPYLVTAKHVIQKKDGSFYKEIFVRMNTKDSTSKFTYVEIEPNLPYKNVFTHDDPSVDIAVIPYAPPKKDYIFNYLDSTFLLEKQSFKSLNLQEGTDAFFTGLFTAYTGEKKIYPIVRFGRISLITDEKIDWVGMKREMLLVETSSYGGNSGSPIYFNIVDPSGIRRLILGGVLNGTYRDVAEIKVVETGFTPVAIYNNGISGITPVYLLRDILYSKEQLRLRD